MSISFNCPYCHKPYRIEDALAGRHVKCRNCAGELTVPPAGELGIAGEAEPAQPEIAPAVPPPLPVFPQPASVGTPPPVGFGSPPKIGVPPPPPLAPPPPQAWRPPTYPGVG